MCIRDRDYVIGADHTQGGITFMSDVDAHAGNAVVAGYMLSLIHISEPTRQEAISYAVFCLKKKKTKKKKKKK